MEHPAKTCTNIVPTTKSLNQAVLENDIELVKVFIQQGSDLNCQDEIGQSLLHIAVKKGYSSVFKLLIDGGADVKIQDNKGETCLHEAARQGSLEIFKILFDLKNKFKRKIYDKAFRIAVGNKNKNLVSLLLENGCNPNIRDKFGMTVLHCACMGGCYEIVELILSHGGNPNLKNCNGATSLHITLKYHMNLDCKKRILIALLEKGGDPNIQDKIRETPLHLTCSSGFYELIKVILKYGGNPNIQNEDLSTPLHELFYNCSYLSIKPSDYHSFIMTLLDNGCDMNIQDKYRNTALHYFCDEYADESSELIKLMIENGANPNIKNISGSTPLHNICGFFNSTNLISFLVEKGYVKNIHDGEGNTLLHIACSRGVADNVETLLHSIEQPDILNKNGETALHKVFNSKYASSYETRVTSLGYDDGDMDMCLRDQPLLDDLHGEYVSDYEKTVSTILYGGADINICLEYQTPLYLAVHKGLKKISFILGQHIIMRRCAKFFVNSSDLELLESLPYDFEGFQQQCQKEVDLLKCSTIGNSAVSYYTVLKRTARRLTPLFRNQEVVQIMATQSYLQLFPIYGNFFKWTLERALKMRNLEEQAAIRFNIILGSLPIVCIDKILSFLEDDELRVMASL